MRYRFIIGAALSAVSLSAHAVPVSPQYDVFGPLPAATFAGSGIPNSEVAITNLSTGTLGLTAHQRFVNPAVTSPGSNGIFQATPGADVGNGQPTYARWNFGFYANSSATDLTYRLFYDTDPGINTDLSNLGSISIGSGAGTFENSWNLGMAFLQIDLAPFITPPLYGAFDPAVAGEYSFMLQASDTSGVVGTAAILVNVGNVTAVPEPGTLALLAAALAGTWLRRRRKV